MAAAYTAGARAPAVRDAPGLRSAMTCRRSTRRSSTISCPFTGETLATVPAINPDVTILHAQQADRAGNVLLRGIIGAQKEAALAARHAHRHGRGDRGEAGCADECHRAAVLGRHRGGARCPPGPTRPMRTATTSATTPSTSGWDEIARDRSSFTAWMQRHVLGTLRPRAVPALAAARDPRAKRGLMSAPAYTPDEMMTVAAARLLWDGCVCFVGIGLPSAAANLARLTHAPNVVLIYESGTIGTRPQCAAAVDRRRRAGRERNRSRAAAGDLHATGCRAGGSTSASSAPRRSTASATSTAR